MEAEIEGKKGGIAVKKRIVSIELLRIISMMMVVMLHYLSKGNLLQSLLGGFGTGSYIAWFLESFCIVAVNVYMLISGYFLVESDFKLSRLVELICQVLFYSILIPLILVAVGVLPVGELGIYRLAMYALPIHMDHYWFASAYVLMYLFAPLLAKGVKAMDKKQLQLVLGALLLYLCVFKSVVPVQLTQDNFGYDAIWFMCVFLVAAYIRLYGIPFFSDVRKGILCYALAAIGIFAWTMLVRVFCLRWGIFESYVQNAYHYNHVLNLFAAVALFCGFIKWDITGEGVLVKLIRKVAPYTFGVYLLHEHVEVRLLWPLWCGADVNETPWMMIFRAFLSVVLVFCVGIAADMARGRVFTVVRKFWRKKRGGTAS